MPHNIVETAREAGTFQTLLAAVDAAGLGDTLADGGPFTVFAPTDDAFAMLPQETVQGLLADPPALARVLTYHVVPAGSRRPRSRTAASRRRWRAACSTSPSTAA